MKSIAAIETTITRNGTTSIGRRYFISSLPACAKTLLSVARSHWSIENKLHWPLDRYFDEDRSIIRDTCGAQNASFLRSVAIALLQHDQKQRSNQGINIKRQTVNRKPDLLLQSLLNWA